MCPRLSTLCVDGCWQLHIASSFTMEKLPAREFGKQLAKLAKASSLQTVRAPTIHPQRVQCEVSTDLKCYSTTLRTTLVCLTAGRLGP